MTWADAGPKLAAALVAGTLAILLATHRAREGRVLGIFLALITVNQLAETFRALDPGPAASVVLFKIASLAAALDPAVLFWAWSGRPGARTPRWALPLVLGVSGALAIAAGWSLGAVPTQDPRTHPFPLALALFTLAVYGAVLVEAYLPPGRPGMLGAAFSVVCIPVAARVAREAHAILGIDYAGRTDATYLLHAVGIPFLAVAAFCVLPLLRRVPGGALGVVLALLIFAMESLQPFQRGLAIAGWTTEDPSLVVAGRIATSVRWLLVGALASMALFSSVEGAQMGIAARRRAARVLLGVTFTLAAATVLFAAGAYFPTASLRLGEVVVLLVAVSLSQAFRQVVDRAAYLAFDVPLPGDAAAAHDAYRRAAALALSQGRVPADDPHLLHLRAELGVDQGTARALERSAEHLLEGPVCPGHVLMGRYRIDAFVGRGSSGRVFAARDVLLDRKVVVKELPRGEAEDDAALREARVAGSLQHPHVLVVHDVARRGAYDYLITEYAAGGSLDERLRAPLDAAEAERILREVLAGLSAMHAHGILHRDVKPQNVLLTAEGHVRLADFGLARRRADETVGGSMATHFAGTPAFLPPEVRRGEAFSPAADVFAAGVLAGRLFPEGVPSRLLPLVTKATDPEPARRFVDAGAFLEALQGARQ